MKKTKKIVLLGLGSLFVLAGCGGGDDAPPPAATPTLNAHYFVGTSKENGAELWKSDGSEAGTVLVKDIGTASPSNPSNFIEFGGVVYFAADNGINGVELIKFDGLANSLVKDLNPAGDSNPRNMVVMNGKLYFVADGDGSTANLWETDGSTAGTVKVGGFTDVGNLTVMAADNTLYFTSKNGTSLWKYDGATVPTDPVVAASTFSDAARLTVVGTDLYFVALNGFGYELWLSNATATGIVKDLCANSCNGMSPSSALYNVNGKLFFTDVSNIVYTTDGTDANTLPVLDTSSANLVVYGSGENTGAGGGLFYFVRNTDGRVWRTDGTAAMTFSVMTPAYYDLKKFNVAASGDVYFTSSNYLFRSNGTQGGTISIISGVSDVKVTTTGSRVYYLRYGYNMGYVDDGGPFTATFYKYIQYSVHSGLYAGADKVYFSSYDPVHNNEPWVSDGTDAGTIMLTDANQMPVGGSYPYDKAVLNGVLYFVASSGEEGNQLWKTDGTAAGTVRLTKNLYDVYNLTVSGNKLFFVGDDDDEYGRELWVTDGSEEGTHMVVDLEPGSRNSNPKNLTDVNGTLFFIDGNNWMLWKTDGTLEGTLPVSGLVTPHTPLYAAGNKVYFVYDDNKHGRELWVSDGTFAGTKMVKDIYPGYNDGVDAYDFTGAAIGDVFYFAANDGVNGRELWKSDGTEAGTQMVINLAGNDDGLDYDNDLGPIAVGGKIYFLAYNDFWDYELWKSDGTTEGTVKLTDFADLGGYIGSSAMSNFALYKGEVYFVANDDQAGGELWKSDGTLEGTKMLKDIHPSGGSYPYGFGIYNNILFFIANDGIHGEELWKTDGTEAGTQLVKDINQGSDNGAYELEEGDYAAYWDEW